jgi:TetR/AcrR family transcriptional regulator
MNHKKQSLEDHSARDRVLKAAIHLFTQRGFAATTVREIVEAAGVTKPILYYYFGNKEGIYLEILKGVTKVYHEILEKGLRYEGSPSQKIRDFGRDCYRNFEQLLSEARLLHSIYYGPPQGAPHFDFEVFHKKFEQTVKSLVQQAVRAGEVSSRHADSLALAVMAVINLANESQMIKSGQPLGDEGLERILAWLLQLSSPLKMTSGPASRQDTPAIRMEGRKKHAAKNR